MNHINFYIKKNKHLYGVIIQPFANRSKNFKNTNIDAQYLCLSNRAHTLKSIETFYFLTEGKFSKIKNKDTQYLYLTKYIH